jgi:hypothetical protein
VTVHKSQGSEFGRTLPSADGGGPNGALITTRDGADGSISSPEIETVISNIFG